MFPPQPDGIWDVRTATRSGTTSEGEDRYRRGLYTFFRRTSPYPLHDVRRHQPRVLHGAARPDEHAAAGADLLNDQVFFEAARALADRVTERLAAPDRRSTAARQRRVPALHSAGQPERARIDLIVARTSGNWRTTGPGRPTPPRSLRSRRTTASRDAICAELAAWTLVANVLLNLDERDEVN